MANYRVSLERDPYMNAVLIGVISNETGIKITNKGMINNRLGVISMRVQKVSLKLIGIVVV